MRQRQQADSRGKQRSTNRGRRGNRLRSIAMHADAVKLGRDDLPTDADEAARVEHTLHVRDAFVGGLQNRAGLTARRCSRSACGRGSRITPVAGSK